MKTSLKEEAVELGKRAKQASRLLARISTEKKNRALLAMAEGIERQGEFLLQENKKDLEFAEKAGISCELLDRATLDPARIQTMARGLRDVAALANPVGEVVNSYPGPN